jgi:hypothetical protein
MHTRRAPLMLAALTLIACADEPAPQLSPKPSPYTPCVEDDPRAECAPPAPPLTYEELMTTLGADCAPSEEGIDPDTGYHQWSWRFTLPDDATSFVATPLTTSGKVITRTLRTPTTLVDLVHDYRHHNTDQGGKGRQFRLLQRGTYDALAFDAPVLFPYASQRADLVVPGGEYTLTAIASEPTTPCLIIAPDRAKTTHLKLNIYLVGLEGITPQSAPRDVQLKALISLLRTIFSLSDIKLDAVNYLDVPEEALRFSILRGDEAHLSLTAYGRAPTTQDEILSLDVFMVRDILSELGEQTPLGISGALPGAPGLHGNMGNGVVFSGALLGSDNRALAHVMAHEIGHYLGLRHTTEAYFGAGTTLEEELEQRYGLTDPIEDTPVCTNLLHSPELCPDARNLMFPFYMNTYYPDVTEGQRFVLHASPLTRAAVIR